MLGISSGTSSRSFHWPTSPLVHGKHKEIQRSRRRASSVNNHEPLLRPVNETLGRSLEFDLQKHTDGAGNRCRRSRSFSTCSYTFSKGLEDTGDGNKQQRKPRSSSACIVQSKNLESDLHKHLSDKNRSRSTRSSSVCGYEESKKIRSSSTEENQRENHEKHQSYGNCKVRSGQYSYREDTSTRQIRSSSKENHVTRKIRTKSFEEDRLPLSRQASHSYVVQADVNTTRSSPNSYRGKSKIVAGKVEQAVKMPIPTITMTDYDSQCTKQDTDDCPCQEDSTLKSSDAVFMATENAAPDQDNYSLRLLDISCEITGIDLKSNKQKSAQSWLQRKIVNKCLKMRRKSIS